MEVAKDLLEKRKIASDHSMGLSHQVIYDRVMSILKENKLNEGLFLDFGAGQGEFVKLIKKNFNFEVHGIDLMHTKVDGVEWYVHDLNQRFPLSANSYNVVTAIEVIEHLENPRMMVRDIYRVLKPNGRIIVTTPNNESWRALISYLLRGHFVAFTDSSYPAHITALNRLDLERIFLEAGYRDIQFYYTNQGMVPKVAGMTWQRLSGGLLKGLRYSDNLIITALK